MSNFKLYEISNECLRLIDRMFDDPLAGIDAFNEMKEEFEKKCIDVAKYIKNMEAEYVAIKQAADDMNKRAKSVAGRVESLTDYLKYNIEKTGLLDPIKCPEFDIKLQQNPVSLVIEDAELIPDLYKVKKEVIEIDKALLKQDIKDGFEVEGAKLVYNKRLVIK